MILFIYLLTLSLLSLPVSAQEFTEYQENPVLVKTAPSTGIAQPFVTKEGNVFTMWFAEGINGGAQISVMKSANGIDWYNKKTLQLSNSSINSDPFIVQKNGEYIMYFASYVSGAYTVWKSTSADGETFNPTQAVQVLKPELPWERTNISSPAVIEDGGITYLFYAANAGGNWSLGLATSIDGLTWQKCPNNPFIANSSGPYVVKYNNIFYLYYASSTGLQVQETSTLNGCETIWTTPRSLTPRFSDPSPVQVGNDIWLYGFSNTAAGQTIWLAGSSPIQKPSYLVVLIPGMFASWNADALLHNATSTYDAWKLNPGVTEYDAFKQTLTSIGRTENNGYYLFAYDWRNPIEETAENLNSFLLDKIWKTSPYQPIQIVGHSLGGVVGRIFADKNPTKPIKQVITAGSPLQGIVQAYKPLTSGEIERENTLTWLAMKLILYLNKPLFQSESDAIAERLPVAFDLLPAFPFLKDINGSFITSPLVNSLISRYPLQSSLKIVQFNIGGSGTQTIAGYTPTSSWKEDGDGVVLGKSHMNSITPAPIQNHGEILYTKESIKTILSKLNIQVADTDIPAGKATSIFPAILAFIQSPALIQIERDGAISPERNNMVWLQNATNGQYTLRVTGTQNGEYAVSVWLIGSNQDSWKQFRKQTSPGKEDEYIIQFDTSTGGGITEYIQPTPTNTPTPTLTPIPTLTPTRKPTCAPKPSKTPTPTQKPKPTKHPTKRFNWHLLREYIHWLTKR